MKKIIYLIFVTLFTLSSCVTFHNGGISSGPLLNINDKYSDVAIATSKSLFVFGFGDLDNDKLVLDAKAKLRINRPLRINEYYSNFTTDISKKIILGIVVINKVTVSVDVLSQDNATNNKTAQTGLLQSNNPISKDYFVSSVDTFRQGEKVYFETTNRINECIISSFTDSNIFLELAGNKAKIFTLSKYEVLYSTKKSVNGFKVGEVVDAKIFFKYDPATIMGFTNTNVLLSLDNELYVKGIDQIKKKY